MDLPGLISPIAPALASAVSEVLGSRLAGLVVYGSAVTGDILPGYSDFDFLVAVIRPVTLDDALALEAATGHLDIAPFTYLQPTFTGRDAGDAVLVPGGFAVIVGEEPRSRLILHAEQLRSGGEEWLARLPVLLARDAADWSFTTSASRARQARLHLTRVKPSLRALLVRHGCDPRHAWTTTWAEIEERLAAVDPAGAGLLADVLASARARDDRAVAVSALRLLGRICVGDLDHDSEVFRIAP